jgi:membrane-associated phospholipid phosphatase
MKFNTRHEIIPTLSRVSPVLLIIITLLNCIVNPGYHSFYLFIIFIALFPINWIIKNLIVKPIYNLLKIEYIPILGIGKRPKGANSCQFILDNNPSFSFGMPSGHSQIIWTVGTYIICRIVNNWINNTKNHITITVLGYIWLIVSCCIILCTLIYVSYSRVYIEGCHTIQQVIVGGLIGIITGIIVFYFEDIIINSISK